MTDQEIFLLSIEEDLKQLLGLTYEITHKYGFEKHDTYAWQISCLDITRPCQGNAPIMELRLQDNGRTLGFGPKMAFIYKWTIADPHWTVEQVAKKIKDYYEIP